MKLTKSRGTRRRASHNKRGGYWGEVVKQAIVPLGLLAMQQSYDKNSYYNNHTKTAARRTRRRGRRTFYRKHK